MKRHLNTLYVTKTGAYLAKDGEAVDVRLEGESRLRVPIHNLEGIVCLGTVGFSPQLLALAGDRGVTVSFLSESGRFLARLQGPVSGNVLLRREQYRRADLPAASADLARAFLTAKIANCRTVLRRAGRERSGEAADSLAAAADRLTQVLRDIDQAEDVDRLRGLEGHAAREYFSVWSSLLRHQHRKFQFGQRSRRPPLDPANSLLSFAYTLLRHDVEAALEGVGLDPAVGYLHRDRPGRPSLALDVMEELRPYLADRLVLNLINRRQVTASGFRKTASGAILMDDDTRRTVLEAWQVRKDDEIEHPFLEERVTVGLVPHLQALLLARYLRGDLDGYPPFLWSS